MDAVEKLIIKDECQALSLRFGRLQDERRYEELPKLMTPDGTYSRLGEELTIVDFIEWVDFWIFCQHPLGGFGVFGKPRRRCGQKTRAYQ